MGLLSSRRTLRCRGRKSRAVEGRRPQRFQRFEEPDNLFACEFQSVPFPLTRLTAMADLVRRHLPELGDGAQLFCLISLVSACSK
mgnify:CR=1 FL=1